MARVKWNGPAVQRSITQIAIRNLGRAAAFAAGKVRASMRKGGKTKAGVVHSLPGQVPFVQSGHLRSSVFSRVRRAGRDLVGEYGARTKYARRLEEGFIGTDRAGRKVTQLPRPYLRPVLVKWRAQIMRIIGRGV